MAKASSIKKAMDAGQRTKGTSVLVYGAPKTGKSALTAQLAEHYRLTWLDIENGAEVLFNSKVVDPKFLDNIELYQIPDHKKNPVGIEYAMKLFTMEKLTLCEQHNMENCSKCRLHNAKNPDDQWGKETIDFNTLDPSKDIVVLDTLTQATRSANALIIKKQLANNDEAKFEFDHWRLQNMYVDIILDMCQAGLFNVVCITHEQGIDQVDGTEKITPSASTKNYSRTIAKNFNTVVRCTMRGTNHVVEAATSEAPKAITGGRTEVNVQRDGLAAIFNPALRTPEPEKATKKKDKPKPSTSTLAARLRKS